MMKKNLIQIILIFLSFLIKESKLSQEEVLNKYGSIKTKYSSMIINSTDFNLGDDIYLTFNSESNCDEYLRYQFYDEIKDIYNQTSDLKYNMRPGSKAITHLLGSKTHLSLYYTINKNKGYLENLKGNILYIEFKCEGEVEIKNTKDNASIIYLYIGIFIAILFLIIFCFLVAKGCLFWYICLKFVFKKRMYNVDNIGVPVNLGNNQLYMNYPQNSIVYVTQPQNEFNNVNSISNNMNYNYNYNFNPNNMPQNIQQYPYRQINSEISANSEFMNSTERNFVSQGS